MPDSIQSYSTSKYTDAQIGPIVEAMMVEAKDTRRNFERRWYDNKFFDDGFHFRYLSRQANKIVDLSDRANLWNPMRAIPKASKQVRGMVNLLVSQDYTPVVYPERVNKKAFEVEQLDPKTGQPAKMVTPEYQKAVDEAKRVAQVTGHWIEEEFKKQEIKEQKIPHMGLLTAIGGISYLKIWPDSEDEEINSTVRDSFDVYVKGSLTELTDLPYLGEGVPRSIAAIKADDRFDEEQTKQISPDNKQASSEIKDAYMRSQYGSEFSQSEYTATLIQKEWFIKEYLNDENLARIRLQPDGEQILRRHTDTEGKIKYGDPVLRQVFVAGNIPLRGQYTNLPDYPYVDFRMEPGPLYQVPLIERFIPANKSLDMAVSRVERYLHTMVTGSWSIKTGEPQEPTNSAGGQIFKYNTNVPVQNPIAPIPPFVFNFMNLLGQFMEEQGVSTSTYGKIPTGVKAASAIESLKESEYASLVVASKQLKKTIKKTSEKMLDLADDYFISPQTYSYLERGEPQYADFIGATALKKRQEMNLTRDLSGDEIPLKRDHRVEIEVQSGLGYTKEGKKAAAKELGDWLVQMAQLGMISPEVVKVFTQSLFEEYSFGPTQDIMEAMEEAMAGNDLTEKQLDAMKLAVAEVMKDLIKNGILPDQDQRIEETKVGVAEALSDTGIADKLANDPKAQLEIAKGMQEMKLKEEEHNLKMEAMNEDMEVKKAEASQSMNLKEIQTESQIQNNNQMTKQKVKLMRTQPTTKSANNS